MGSVSQDVLTMRWTELDGDVFVFIFHGLACILWVACFACVCLFGKRVRHFFVAACVHRWVFLFFDKAVRASCSSYIFMLFKGLFFPHINICSTSFDASSYCSDTRGSNIINDLTHLFTLIKSNSKASSKVSLLFHKCNAWCLQSHKKDDYLLIIQTLYMKLSFCHMHALSS